MKKTYFITTLLIIIFVVFAACEQPAGSIVDPPGFDSIREAIDEANILNNSISVGIDEGNVIQIVKDDFTAAIAKAQAVASDSEASQQEIDAALAALETAIDIFKASPES